MIINEPEKDFVAAFINTKELPEKKEHICYTTQCVFNDQVEYVRLYAVEREYYKHPYEDVAEYGILIPILKINFIKQCRADNPRAVSMMLLDYAQTNVKNVVNLL